MPLPTQEFIRGFLSPVLPKGFHRIRHYGLFANGNRAANIARARELLAVPKHAEKSKTAAADQPYVLPRPCRCCGGRMIIIERPSRPAANQNTAPRPLQQRSESTPHDTVTAIHQTSDARQSRSLSASTAPAC